MITKIVLLYGKDLTFLEFSAILSKMLGYYATTAEAGKKYGWYKNKCKETG